MLKEIIIFIYLFFFRLVFSLCRILPLQRDKTTFVASFEDNILYTLRDVGKQTDERMIVLRFSDWKVTILTAASTDGDKNMSIRLMADFKTSEDYHELSEKAELNANEWIAMIGLSYDPKKKTWTVDNLEPGDPWGNFEAAETIAGDKKLYAPSKETVANAKAKERNDAIKEMMDAYTQASVDAINYREFSFMSDYLTKDGPRRKEAPSIVSHLFGLYRDVFCA